MKFSLNVRRIAGLVGLCALLSPLAAQEIDLTQTVSVNGWPKPIPVNLSGFSGEVDATLRQDLILMGVAPTSPAQATYSVTGSNGGRVEGSVTDKISKSVVLAKAYTGGSLRSQAHAFADDIAKALTGKPGIAQTRIAF